MSDAREAILQALAAQRRLAASLRVRKEDLLARQAEAPSEARAREVAELEAAERAALAEIAALQRLAVGAGADADRAMVAAAVAERDPLTPSHEERALAAARAQVAEWAAEAEIDGVGVRGSSGAELDVGAAGGSPSPASPSLAPATREDKDAAARAEFEALRARRGLGGGATGQGVPADAGGSASDRAAETAAPSADPAAASPADPAAVPPRPKRTL